MRIAYAYNEILPKKSAHDVYVVRNCAALSAAGCEVTVLCGKGSLPPAQLASHYQIAEGGVQWKSLPIVRKNLPIPITCNAVFFWATQYEIRRRRPEWLFLSVLKQGAFHLKRKVPGVRYVYEVHELAWYPGRDAADPQIRPRLEMERRMLSAADAVTVTTGTLKDILLAEPYGLRVPVEVVPLAVDFPPLPALPPVRGDVHLMYVGQMYRSQGVELLLEALAATSGVRLTLVGGKADQLAQMKQLAASLGVAQRVEFAGFRSPSELPALAAEAHALVAPFSATGRMPYVAHTKLLEYAAWQRPVVAPDLPVTREYFGAEGGWLPFVPDDAASLAAALQALTGGALEGLYAASRCHKVLPWSARSNRYLEMLRSR